MSTTTDFQETLSPAIGTPDSHHESKEAPLATDSSSIPRYRPPWIREAIQPTFIISVLILVWAIAAAIVPTAFTSYDPYLTDIANKFQPVSFAHLFGTDSLGRDQFARFVFGTSNTLLASLLAVSIGFIISAFLGIIAGYFKGIADESISRFIDIFLAVPGLLVSLLIVTSLGFSTLNIALAVGTGSIASFTRILRSEVFRVRERDYITAAQINGLPWYKILVRHIFPHSIGPIVSLLPLQFGEAVLLISSLSFLGFGAQPPETEWGLLVSDGRTYLSTAWWIAVLPGVGIALVVLAANRIGKYFERVL